MSEDEQDKRLELALSEVIATISERLPPGVEFALEISATRVGFELFNVPTTGLIVPNDYLPKPEKVAGESLGTYVRRCVQFVASLRSSAASGSCPTIGQEAFDGG